MHFIHQVADHICSQACSASIIADVEQYTHLAGLLTIDTNLPAESLYLEPFWQNHPIVLKSKRVKSYATLTNLNADR